MRTTEPRCAFKVFKTDPHARIIYIVDQDLGRTVTNDAANVCRELHAQYADYRIIYRDTEGNWDELLHDKGKHTGFRSARHMRPV